jgi:hypothetical protein
VHDAALAAGTLTRDGTRGQLTFPEVIMSRRQKEEGNIAQDYVGQKVVDILKRKKASIQQARLPQGSPDWDTFMEMTWEQIEVGARANRSGFKVVRKLLTDKRFDK